MTRHALALAAICGLTVASVQAEQTLADRIEVTGVEILVHEAGEAVQTVRAERAHLSPTGEAIDAFGVTVDVHDTESGEVITLTSPRGRIFHAVTDRVDVPMEREPSQAQLRLLAAEILSPDDDGPRPTMVRQSDFILFTDPADSDETVLANLGERGSVSATTIYWGEYWQKFISLGPFEQISREEGETIRMRGTGFHTEMSFNYWDYFTLDGVETEFELVAGQEANP